MDCVLNTFLQNRWRKFGLWFAFWTLLTLLSAAQTYVSQVVMERPVPWLLALRRSSEEWYVWAALSIGIVWLARRFPLERGKGRRWFFLHLIASLIAAVLFVAIHAALLHGQKSIDGTTFAFAAVFKKLLIYYCHMNMIVYWMIVLAHHGWHYYHRYREREQQASALATELVQARLEVLRMQLNPHFLFNTLHTISALIHDNPEAADRIVARLSELLRHTLDLAETQEVCLREELAFLEGYLEIERTRFQDRLTVEMEIESGLDDLMVPSLILQPLTENAIRHGIEPREDMGRVTIRAQRANGRLELSVTDNGPGLPEAESMTRREGVGLSNTRSRLAHLYGPDHEFELKEAPGGGLEVRLSIPCRTEARTRTPRVLILSKAEAGVIAACKDTVAEHRTAP